MQCPRRLDRCRPALGASRPPSARRPCSSRAALHVLPRAHLQDRLSDASTVRPRRAPETARKKSPTIASLVSPVSEIVELGAKRSWPSPNALRPRRAPALGAVLAEAHTRAPRGASVHPASISYQQNPCHGLGIRNSAVRPPLRHSRPWLPPSNRPLAASRDSHEARLHLKKSVRFRTHFPTTKSQFGSELTFRLPEKVSSVPNSLSNNPKKSVRFRTHFPTTRKSQFGSELTFRLPEKVSSVPNSLFGRAEGVRLELAMACSAAFALAPRLRCAAFALRCAAFALRRACVCAAFAPRLRCAALAFAPRLRCAAFAFGPRLGRACALRCARLGRAL
jgi:hypothetical protein